MPRSNEEKKYPIVTAGVDPINEEDNLHSSVIAT